MGGGESKEEVKEERQKLDYNIDSKVKKQFYSIMLLKLFPCS
jgi:hypothetical protein